MQIIIVVMHALISIHALLAESDAPAIVDNQNVIVISIHALLAESDWSKRTSTPCAWKFLSTLSLRRATFLWCSARAYIPISIHALLAESDDMSGATGRIFRAFLSTLSLRRATMPLTRFCPGMNNFYPRSPCGERRADNGSNRQYGGISIHALLAESDRDANEFITAVSVFLSTLSLRRATNAGQDGLRHKTISIHALLAESDNLAGAPTNAARIFLSTLSLRRATVGQGRDLFLVHLISIHALLAESDNTSPTK